MSLSRKMSASILEVFFFFFCPPRFSIKMRPNPGKFEQVDILFLQIQSQNGPLGDFDGMMTGF